jgi:hypothetical protein
MILSAMFMFPAYGETDVFGNPIEWDMEAEPDEDFIGNDNTDFIEPPTYTDEEQQVMNLLPESTYSNLYGEFLVTGDFNSLWPNLNVVVVLYDENNHRWEDTHMNKINTSFPLENTKYIAVLFLEMKGCSDIRLSGQKIK